jgi:hypothetical protein
VCFFRVVCVSFVWCAFLSLLSEAGLKRNAHVAEEERAYVRGEAGSRGRESALKVNLAYRLCYSSRDIPSASRSRERERARERASEGGRERET